MKEFKLEIRRILNTNQPYLWKGWYRYDPYDTCYKTFVLNLDTFVMDADEE